MVKRSSTGGIAGQYQAAQGVGGRQTDTPIPWRGGGYLNECTPPEFSKKNAAIKKGMRDPRLDELQRMGLQRPWIEGAEALGVDAILTLWRILDADPSSSYDGTTLRVPLRAWRTYLRFQRNRYIEDLHRRKVAPDEIQRRLLRQLGEKVSISHIKRIAAGR
jgi:hypothetical protein